MMAGLIAVAWMAALWILDTQRIDPALRAPAQASTRTPRPSPPAAEPPIAAPAAPPAAQAAASPRVAPRATASAARAAAPPVAAAVNSLTYALPLEVDSAAPMFEALTRQVAAPAGLDLRPAAPGDPPLLTLQRTDALLAARSGIAAPLQVVAPLFSEQVQVVVRNDARWDYVREIRRTAAEHRPRQWRAREHRACAVPAVVQRTAAGRRHGRTRRGAGAAVTASARRPDRCHGRGLGVAAVGAVAAERAPPAARVDNRPRRHEQGDGPAGVLADPAHAWRTAAACRSRTFLVATGAPPRPQDEALRLLAMALCRAQPALQAQRSPLLRGFAQGAATRRGLALPATQAARAGLSSEARSSRQPPRSVVDRALAPAERRQSRAARRCASLGSMNSSSCGGLIAVLDSIACACPRWCVWWLNR